VLCAGRDFSHCPWHALQKNRVLPDRHASMVRFVWAVQVEHPAGWGLGVRSCIPTSRTMGRSRDDSNVVTQDLTLFPPASGLSGKRNNGSASRPRPDSARACAKRSDCVVAGRWRVQIVTERAQFSPNTVRLTARSTGGTVAASEKGVLKSLSFVHSPRGGLTERAGGLGVRSCIPTSRTIGRSRDDPNVVTQDLTLLPRLSWTSSCRRGASNGR
jgi:hypothetical protein